MKTFNNMKNSTLIITIIFLLIIHGCEKFDEAIDLVPISSKSAEGFYSNQEELNQAIVAIYGSARGIFVGHSRTRMTVARSDNAMASPAYWDGDISRFIETPLNSGVGSMWSSLYNMIMRCNRLLDELPDVEGVSQAKMDQFEGEAKFWRAMAYRDLVRYWGGVPLVTKRLTLAESWEVGRSSVAEVYAQIVKDFTEASNLLPDSYSNQDYGRVTSWAAKAYLGKALMDESGWPLYNNKWADARDALNAVIQSGEFSFFDNYEDLFLHANEMGNQAVLRIMFVGGVIGNSFPTYQGPNHLASSWEEGGIPYGGHEGNMKDHTDLIDSFEPGDLRKEGTLRFEWKNIVGETITSDIEAHGRKYQDGPAHGRGDWDINFSLLRYADVLMRYAECLNEIGYVADGEAFDILNQIRERAGLLPKTSADVPNQESYRLWMQNERRWEFALEHKRWFDLVRTDMALDVMQAFLAKYPGTSGYLTSRNQYYYPIPIRALQDNKNVKQNDGY